MTDSTPRNAATVAREACSVSTPSDYDPLIELAGTAELVMIGEASHGTHEFYETRAELTKRLIAEKQFRVVALEADWPDALRAHRYVTDASDDRDARSALGNFRRFPSWMWRNTVMVEFVEWLREWNDAHPNSKAGIFGLDLYSMHSSIESVLGYLDAIDPLAAKRARERYSCFDFFGGDPQQYGYQVTRGRAESCEEEVIAQLRDLQRRYSDVISRDGKVAEDEFFYAEQNARLVANAERYYRAMYHGRDESWNLRDEHMTDTLLSLIAHHEGARTIAWAHNSHLGDSRATEMGRRGEWNVGQLVRERFERKSFSIGFSTYSGTVTASRDWGAIAECRRVRPGLDGSYEELLHDTHLPEFWVDLGRRNDGNAVLRNRRLERAIGVIYRPETERWSHYFEACLPDQFDAIIHIDVTNALEPLEKNSSWEDGELPDTFPAGV